MGRRRLTAGRGQLRRRQSQSRSRRGQCRGQAPPYGRGGGRRGEDVRRSRASAWADVAADVAAFHNNKGGLLVFGIRDADFRFVGTRDRFDAKLFNDQLRRYIGDKLWVEFSREFIQADQRYLGVALVPPRGLMPLRMRCDAPQRPDGNRAFLAGDLCIREGDQTRVLHQKEAQEFLASRRLPAPTSSYFIEEPTARILRPDWEDFVFRDTECKRILAALKDDRTYITTVTGVGGVGKTALACWATLEAYNAQSFQYFVSISAKDRMLTPSGIAPVVPGFTSFEDLLNQVLEVLGFSDQCAKPVDDREAVVRELLAGTSALLFVDNLETVDDPRVVRFLETLPKPVKALTTSRLAAVKTAAFPLTVGPLTETEAIKFLEQHARRLGRESIRGAQHAEKMRLVLACDRVPLAIEWLVGHSKSLTDALGLADVLATSGKRDQELLEFCFRRVHSQLHDAPRAVLAALALQEKPMILEAVSAATELPLDAIDEALAELEGCALVERVWDEKMRDFASRVLPLTRRFAYRELQTKAGGETRMRSRLSDWYQAKDVQDAGLRQHIMSARRGERDPDAALVDAAIGYRRDGRLNEAERYFQQALDRNPRSWRALRELGELLRDRDEIGGAIDCCEKAIANAPKRGSDRALIFRESGMLWRKSGQDVGLSNAIERFEVARKETPHDPVLLHALADAHCKLGHYAVARPLLESLVLSSSPETRARTYPLLERCYGAAKEQLKLLELRDRIEQDTAASGVETTSGRVRVWKPPRHPGRPKGPRK